MGRRDNAVAAVGILALLYLVVDAVVFVVQLIVFTIVWFAQATPQQRTVAVLQLSAIVLAFVVYNAWSVRQERRKALEDNCGQTCQQDLRASGSGMSWESYISCRDRCVAAH